MGLSSVFFQFLVCVWMSVNFSNFFPSSRLKRLKVVRHSFIQAERRHTPLLNLSWLWVDTTLKKNFNCALQRAPITYPHTARLNANIVSCGILLHPYALSHSLIFRSKWGPHKQLVILRPLVGLINCPSIAPSPHLLLLLLKTLSLQNFNRF